MLLVQADAQACAERDRATFEAWGGPLSLESYRSKVARLRSHAWPRAVLAEWLLCREDGDVLCSCETYRMESRVKDDPRPGHAYGIGSVYTEPRHRRKGYARDLLARLRAHLARVDDRAQALILFSDVALKTYETAGFTARPAISLVFDPLPGDPRDGIEALLTEADVPQVVAGWSPRQDGFTVTPVASQLDWHLERERIFAEHLARPRPFACGARAQGASILWSADFGHNQLAILLLDAPERADAEALLTCARRMAHAAGLPKAVLWKSPSDVAWPSAREEDRLSALESVPMILPLDGRVRAEDWAWIPRALWI